MDRDRTWTLAMIRRAHNRLSHGTGTEACTSSHLFKLGPTAQKTHYVCGTDTKILVLLFTLVSASSQYLTQNTITISGENKPHLSLTECGANNYHSV